MYKNFQHKAAFVGGNVERGADAAITKAFDMGDAELVVSGNGADVVAEVAVQVILRRR